MGEEQTEACPWRDGNYRGEGVIDALVLTGTKAVAANHSFEMRFKNGVFGEVDDEIAEMTGERDYKVEMSFDMAGKTSTNHGVLVQDGTQFFFKAFGLLLTLDWITEEEAG